MAFEYRVVNTVEEASQLRQHGAELVCDLAPLRSRGLGILLGKRG